MKQELFRKTSSSPKDMDRVLVRLHIACNNLPFGDQSFCLPAILFLSDHQTRLPIREIRSGINVHQSTDVWLITRAAWLMDF